jgi:hypothetical protein
MQAKFKDSFAVRALDPALKGEVCRALIKEWRNELRRVAQDAADASMKKAIAQIERYSRDVQKKILAGNLTTEEALLLMDKMPTARELMPPLDFAAIVLEAEKGHR